ncbi:hypothetical protein [Levilactobacillus fujinensis]|nr:hypothetical protein [Levilactobacillus fujinensis]
MKLIETPHVEITVEAHHLGIALLAIALLGGLVWRHKRHQVN